MVPDLFGILVKTLWPFKIGQNGDFINIQALFLKIKLEIWANSNGKLYFLMPYFQSQHILPKDDVFWAKKQSLGKISLWDRFGSVVVGVHKCKKFCTNLLLRWIPGVFTTPGTYHFIFLFITNWMILNFLKVVGKNMFQDFHLVWV